MADNTTQNDNKPQSNKRMFLYYFLIVLTLGLVAVGIIVRACDTALVEKSFWLKIAEKQKQPNRLVKPTRGNIYSYDNQLMATSVPRYYLYMDFGAEAFSEKTRRWSSKDTFLYSKRNGVDSLSVYLSRKFKNHSPAGYKTYLLKGLKSKSRQFPLYPDKVSYIDYKEIQRYPFLRLGIYNSGFYSRESATRQKPFGTLASRTIGDVFGDIDPKTGLTKGKNGLELQYDSLLRGAAGLSKLRRVGGGWTNVIEQEPTDGMDIKTTIDITIQDITEKALVDMLKSIDAASGTAVVMEVNTGEIKAVTNMGRIREGVYGEEKNHAVADETEPGSTFKVASIMVALEDGVCLPSDTVDTGNGIYMYKGSKMTDHNKNKGGYHRISVEEAIWNSSNIGVAKTILKGYENNPTKFVEGLYKLGLNENLNLEIPGAGRAKIRRPDDSLRYWSKTTLPWMSFGYETQIPPIYTLTFYNAIANNGKMIKPVFTKEIIKNGKVIKSFSTEVVRSSICSDKTLEIIKGMLVGVVENGTGKAVHSDIVKIAGKTGTAQIASGGVYRQAGHQVAFCGYFPADEPKYSCIVVIRQPRIGYPSGGTMSGGVFKTIAEKVYANRISFNVDDMEKDSLAIPLPHAKGGSEDALKYVLDELDIDFNDDSVQGKWAFTRPDTSKNEIVMKELGLHKGLVPNVVGMGAKDAVYLMESAGLRVSLSGAGRVVSQSVRGGTKTNGKGQSVSLILR